MKVECRSIIQQFSKVWILTFFLLCIFCKLVLLLNDQVAFTNIWASLHSLTYLEKQWGKKVHVVGVYRSCLIYFEDCHQSNRIIHLGKCLWVQSVRITFWFLTFYIWQGKKKKWLELWKSFVTMAGWRHDELKLVFLNSAEHLKFYSTDSAVISLWKYIWMSTDIYCSFIQHNTPACSVTNNWKHLVWSFKKHPP